RPQGVEKLVIGLLDRFQIFAHVVGANVNAILLRLFTMYLATGKEEKARAIIKKARAEYPDNEALKIQEALLNEPDPQKRLAMQLELAEQAPEPLDVALRKANIYAESGMETEFLQQLREAEKIDPADRRVVQGLFNHALKKEDWTEAEKLVQRIAQGDLDGSKGKVYGARLAIAKAQYADAIELLKEILDERPGTKEFQVWLGECYRMLQENDKAEEFFLAAATSDPRYAPALIGMARVTAALGKIDEHREWLTKAYRIAPLDPYVKETYLTWQQITESASPDELIRDRERLLQQRPDDLQNRLRLGFLYEQKAQLAKAEEMFRSIWEHPTADKPMAARVLLEFYLRLRRFEDGTMIAQQLVEQSEDKAQAYGIYADYLAGFDAGRAKEMYQKAIDADPEEGRGYLWLGRFLDKQGQWSQAADALEKYLEIHPEASVQQRDMIKYLIKGRQFDRATSLLEKVLNADSSDAEALMLMGVIAKRQNQFDEAEKYFTRAIRENPKSSDALYRRGVLYYRNKGDLVKAQRDFEEAQKLSDDPQIAMDLGGVFEGFGDFGRAQLIYAGILRDRPTFQPAIRRLFDLYLKQKRWAPMESLLTETTKRFPADPVYPIYEAVMWKARGQTPRVLGAIEAALEINRLYPQAVRMYLEALIEDDQYDKAFSFAEDYRQQEGFEVLTLAYQGRARAGQNRHAEAEELFLAAMKKVSPELVSFVADQAVRCYGSGEAARKMSAWIEQTNSTDWRMHMAPARLYSSANDPARAIGAYLRALKLANSKLDKAIINRELGTVYNRMGKLAEAQDAYLAALEVLPNDPQILNNLGYIYVENLNDPAKALQYTRRAAQLLPTDANIIDSYGWTLAKLGELQEAEQQLLRAVRLAPDSAIIRYHLGWAYEQGGRLRDAEVQYQEAEKIIRTHPDDPLGGVISEALKTVREKIKG
ncbi:MAG: tetratricopeptide repeat protein, partial [Planctomycetota bacterium]